MTDVEPAGVYVDQGYRGHDFAKTDRVFITRQLRGLTPTIKRELRRRSAIEPMIGHMKADGQLGRNHLLGAAGDAINAPLVAAGHSLPENAREAATGFDTVQKAFHTVLIAACGSARMLAFLDVLYDQGFRYRHLMLKNRKPRQHLQRIQRIDEHKVLAELAIKRDTAGACEMLRHHLMTFADDVFPATGT